MNKIPVLSTVFFLWASSLTAQGPQWDSIRVHAVPEIRPLTAQDYETPFVQPNATDGWEDGIYLSRDGLHLYCFYLPMDLPLFAAHIGDPGGCNGDPCCQGREAYFRGPMYGIDTMPPGAPCYPWIHSDIVYSTRPNVNADFPPWINSNLSDSILYDGAPHSIDNPGGNVDMFVWNTSTNSDDIYILRNVTHNPHAPGQPATGMNTAATEGNPHVEKLSATDYLMLSDNHTDPEDSTDFWYSYSTDGGNTWTPKTRINTLNSRYADLQPHLWNDGTDWWVYFAAADTLGDGRLSIFRAKHNTNNISSAATFDDWGDREFVIGPGDNTWPTAEAIAVGEPSLSQWGDISFGLVTEDHSTPDSLYDRLDLDPWFLPKKGSPMAFLGPGPVTIAQAQAYPNPSAGTVTITFKNLDHSPHSLEIFELSGMLIYRENDITAGQVIVDQEVLAAGTYIYRINSQGRLKGGGKLVIR